ncbi:hypothetical protein TNCT_234221 [Trichonephila clavata]|uniref:Uncharacterized protein n=1 Tax=Trichonephila clavata TaxID=2740835 RepID=A0A8X6INS1_TRICU|nr:hypothetical protein TNCT_234221 [Trichonephila clavata]
MRDDLAFAHCLVKYSSPDSGNLLPFKRIPESSECFTHSRGLTGAGLSTPSPRPRCLVQRSLSFGESGKLRSLAFPLPPNLSNPRTLCSTRWLKGSRRLYSGHLDRMHET